MYQSLPQNKPAAQRPTTPTSPRMPSTPGRPSPMPGQRPAVTRNQYNLAKRRLPGVATNPSVTPAPGPVMTMAPTPAPPAGATPKPTSNFSMIGTAPSPQMGTPVQGSMLPATMPQQNQALMFDPNSSPADHPEGIVGWMRDRDAYRASMAQMQFNPNSSPADHPEGIVGWMRDRDAYRAAQGQAQSNGQQGILTGFSGGATTTFDPALVARIMKQRTLQTAPQIAPMA